MSAFAQVTDTVDYGQSLSANSFSHIWSVGLNGGVTLPFKEDFKNPSSQIGYGVFIKGQLLQTVALQFNFLAGKVGGSNSADMLYSTYLTKIDYAVDMSLNATLANISWNHKKGVIQPFLTAGFGYMGYEPVLTTSDLVGGQIRFPYASKGGNVQSFYFPVGIGLKINLSNDLNLNMGYTVNFVNADNFDGVVYGGRDDKFGYAHIGLEIGLGNTKKAPYVKAKPVVVAPIDNHLAVEQSLSLQIENKKTETPEVKIGPNVKSQQLDAINAIMVKFTTDSDSDGVLDFLDKCPGTPAGITVDETGCPVNQSGATLTIEDRKVVKDAVDNLEFDLGKATIRTVSFAALNSIAQLLINKKLNLKLAGYTDNSGSATINLKLSKDRASAVRTYLITRGVNPSHIVAFGYGSTRPIADNNTEEGRQLNRRVEFSIY